MSLLSDINTSSVSRRTTMASSANLSAEGSGKQQQSPRNTGGQTVANPTAVKLGTIEVPKALQDGEKFLKWDEVSKQGCSSPLCSYIDH